MKSLFLLTLFGLFPPVLAQVEEVSGGGSIFSGLTEFGLVGVLLAVLVFVIRWQQNQLERNAELLTRLVDRKTDAPPNGYDYRPPTQPRPPES